MYLPSLWSLSISSLFLFFPLSGPIPSLKKHRGCFSCAFLNSLIFLIESATCHLDGSPRVMPFFHQYKRSNKIGSFFSLSISLCLYSEQQLSSLRTLDLRYSESLVRTPDFTGMPNLEYLNLEECRDLEEVHHSLGFCRKLIRLNLESCGRLNWFPCVNVESLEYLDLDFCSSLEKFPEIHGRMKREIQIHMKRSGIRELPSSIIQYQTHITFLDLSAMKNLVALPSSICRLKSLVSLNVSGCTKLESLPEEIGDLENLEELYARYALISRPPSTIVRLNKLKILKFGGLQDGVHFEFPPAAEGLRSLEHLDLTCCNLIDGGLPEDIGCLSSLKELYLSGNNFEHLPRSIAQLGALRILNLRNCKRLTQLPELPPESDTIYADWSNDLICNSLFQNISSVQHDISASDSLSLRVFTSVHLGKKPSWFLYQGTDSGVSVNTDSGVSVNLPGNWYIPDKFLGFAVYYSGSLIGTTAQLIPVCDDGMLWMTQKLALSNHSECDTKYNINFFLVPLAGLWDTSKANGKTPNDYGLIRLSFSGEVKKCGLRLLYKEEPEVEALLQMRENNHEPTEHSTWIRRTRYNNSEHDFVINEASCSSGKKQKSHISNIQGSSVFENLQQQVEGPVSSETLQLFPANPGF